MQKKYFSVPITVIFLLIGFITMAQDSTANKKPEMADALRADGKIYVVVAVVVTILTGLILYVARLDRKISKMEK
jgi:multisubunit Na+/H+ antiporter MnhB subunit